MTGWGDSNVLFIGGASCTGKTSLAESLARRLEARYIDLDLFWIVLRRAVPEQLAQDLYLFTADDVYAEHEPAELVERYLRVARYVCDATQPLVAHHDIKGRRVVIEGCWITPVYATQRAYAGRILGAPVRSIFLFEPDMDRIDERIRGRSPDWLAAQTPTAQRNHVEMQWRFGLEIKRQAENLDLPVLESRPFETLEQRALEGLGLAEA